jgi:hypothetical protein
MNSDWWRISFRFNRDTWGLRPTSIEFFVGMGWVAVALGMGLLFIALR